MLAVAIEVHRRRVRSSTFYWLISCYRILTSALLVVGGRGGAQARGGSFLTNVVILGDVLTIYLCCSTRRRRRPERRDDESWRYRQSRAWSRKIASSRSRRLLAVVWMIFGYYLYGVSSDPAVQRRHCSLLINMMLLSCDTYICHICSQVAVLPNVVSSRDASSRILAPTF
jgi:hypothetical protein